MIARQHNKAFSSLLGRSPLMEAVIRTAQIAAATDVHLSLIHISEPTRQLMSSRMPSSA